MCLQSKSEFAPEVKQAIVLGEQGQWAEALASLPHFCFQERDMLNVLAKNPNDFAAAISAIPRPVTMLFCHSVQSLVWNEMASRRIRCDPRHPVEGDLVLLGSESAAATEGGGEGDEAVVEEAKDALPSVHAVTQEEAEGRRFTLDQVVLPVPGPDSQLQFPSGSAMTAAKVDKASYQAYLAGIGAEILLDSAKEGDAFTKKFHFHGTYRKLVAMPLAPSGVQASVKRVATVASPCVDTDLMKLNRENPPTGGNKRERKKERKINESEQKKTEGGEEVIEAEADAVPTPAAPVVETAPAVVPGVNSAFEEPPVGEGLAVLEVSFALGAGCYATSLLREMVNLVRST
jgi:tRNA pseudouridine13 synthase